MATITKAPPELTPNTRVTCHNCGCEYIANDSDVKSVHLKHGVENHTWVFFVFCRQHDEVSWFAYSIVCPACNTVGIVRDHEHDRHTVRCDYGCWT